MIEFISESSVILVSIILSMQVCWAFAVLVYLPLKNRISSPSKVFLLRFLLIVLPLLAAGFSLFSYNNQGLQNTTITDSTSIQNNSPSLTETKESRILVEPSEQNPSSAESEYTEHLLNQKLSPSKQRFKLPSITFTLPEKITGLILLLWITGAGLLLINVLIKRLHTNWLLKSAYTNTNKEWKTILTSLQRKGYPCGKTKLISLPSWNGSPFSYGCIKSSIVVPESPVRWNRKQRQAVMLHELQHISGHDLITGLALDIVHALFWPCAGVRFLIRQLEQAQEERCDMFAVRSSCNPIEYANLLLDLAYSSNSYVMPGAQGYAGKSSITRRINMIVLNFSAAGGKKKKLVYSAVSSAVIISAALLLVFAQPLVYAKPAENEAAQASISKPVETKTDIEIEASRVKPLSLLDFNNPDFFVENITVPQDNLPHLWPIAENLGKVSMDFGYNKHPITGQTYLHKGVDMTTLRAGDPVIATMDSVVYKVDFDEAYGNLLVLKKGNVLVLYAHLKEFSVKAGDTVKTGTQIGIIGNTGVATGPHLHYGIFVCDDSGNAETGFITDTEEAGLLFHGGYWIDALPLMIIPKV